MRAIRNESLKHLKTNKNIDINKIIIKHEFNDSLNRTNTKYNFLKRIRTIILFSTISSIVVGLIIFFIAIFSQSINKKPVSFKRIKNNTDNIDGYYIPKDSLFNPYYKKCSVDNCKKCYGNSNNDTCILCLNAYNPLLNENNKIISCKYNPKKESTNLILKESNEINFDDNISEIKTENIDNKTDYFSKKQTEFISDKTTNYFSEVKTDFVTNIIVDNISTIITEYPTEKNVDINFMTDIKTEINNFHSQITSIKEIITSNKIIICEPGYYLPEEDKDSCKRCSIIGCETCHGNNTINYCDSCFSDYFSKYIDNNLICIKKDINCIKYDNNTFKCLKCDFEYVLYEGKCLAYSFVAIYYSYSSNDELKLINLDSNYIEKYILDDEMIDLDTIFLYVCPILFI